MASEWAVKRLQATLRGVCDDEGGAIVDTLLDALATLLDKIREEERERCAKEVYDIYTRANGVIRRTALLDAVDAIRGGDA